MTLQRKTDDTNQAAMLEMLRHNNTQIYHVLVNDTADEGEESWKRAINDIMVISVVRKLLRACGALLRLKHAAGKGSFSVLRDLDSLRTARYVSYAITIVVRPVRRLPTYS
eukprot:scaffold48121_cov47-Attheya_sp.AAC.15